MYRSNDKPLKVASMAWALCATVFLMTSLGPIGFSGRPFEGAAAMDVAPVRLAGYLA
jgi:hypothetical protein